MADSKAKGRKIGRNAAKCKSYREHQTRERNKLVKVLRHAKRQGLCPDVEKTLTALRKVLPVAMARPIFARFGVEL